MELRYPRYSCEWHQAATNLKEGELREKRSFSTSIRCQLAAAVVGLGEPSIATVSYPKGVFAAKSALDEN
jgi:hypothetical protein